MITNTILSQKTPKAAILNEAELMDLLSNFRGWQQRAVVKFIAENPHSLTHEIHQAARTNNFPQVKIRTENKLRQLGFKIVNTTPPKGSVSKEDRITLCHVGEVEVLSVGKSANDEPLS